MNKLVIRIDSKPQGTQMTMSNNGSVKKRRLFASIDEAIDYTLPLGDRDTTLLLNGHDCTLAGWWDNQLMQRVDS